MEEQVFQFVSKEQKSALPPPESEVGAFGTVRRNLFATPLDSVLSILAGALVLWGAWNLFQWAVLDAVFTGNDREACLVEGGGHGGACWAFIQAKFGQFIYGVYPIAERWRVNLSFALLAILAAGILIPKVPYKAINAVLLFAVFPVVTLVLLTGGRFAFSGGELALVFLIAGALTVSGVAARPDVTSSRIEMRIAVWLLVAGAAAMLLSNVVSAGRS